MAADEPGPDWRRYCSAHPGISRAYVGNPPSQRNRCCWNPSKSWSHYIRSGKGKDSEPRQTGNGGMRMLRNDEQDVSKLGKGIAMRLVSAEGIESTLKRSFNEMQVSG